MLLALFGIIGLVLFARVRRRSLVISLILIAFLCGSTEAFYRLLFVRSSPADYAKKRGCAVALTDGKDIVEAATLVSSIRKLGIDNLYVLSINSDPTLPAQIDQFFMKEQNLKFMELAKLNEEKLGSCIFAYSPHLFCFVDEVNAKYTLLPHDAPPYIPTARFMAINSETLKHCLSNLFH